MKPPPIELPEKYYLDYFKALVTHTSFHYKLLLSKTEKSFIRRFNNLTEDAQCLYLRLVNRRGKYFRMQRITYKEIEDQEAALLLLVKRKFFKKLSFHCAEEILQILGTFTKAELITLASQSLEKKQVATLRKLKKQELTKALIETLSSKDLIKIISIQEPVVRTCYDCEIEMLNFLYFGHINGDITQFVVRDIGYIKTETYDQSKLKALFNNRKEAEDKLKLSKIYQEFKYMRDEIQVEADFIFNWFGELKLEREAICEQALAQYDKLCLRLGKLLEQQLYPAYALQVYRKTAQVPSRERQVRLMHKLKQTQEALILCEKIHKEPYNADERFFAEDFLNRVLNKKRTRKATDYLKNSKKIVISPEHQYRVEQGVLDYFQNEGHDGMHVENYLWRGFFGLFFWDIIFDQDSEAIHHPLQTTPSDFYTPQFLQKRVQAINKRLEVLEHPSRFHNIINHHYETKVGMSNPMVGWHESLLPLVELCYTYLRPKQIASVMLEMAKDLRENSRGFPDLFVWNDEGYQFIEVKSPNDQLSAQQLYWLHFFEEQKINAQVIRVGWAS